MTQIRVLFVCHGNICRSVAAEMVLKQMAREAGRKDLRIASAAATREEIGNDIYPPMKKALFSACILPKKEKTFFTVCSSSSLRPPR